jgi:filamentous hemagglutinin family protein
MRPGVLSGVWLAGAVAVVCLLLQAPGARADGTEITRDGSLGQEGRPFSIAGAPGPAGLEFTIEEADGERVGAALFHSFEFFDVGAGDTAVFEAVSGKTTDHFVSRVTGGRASAIDGQIKTELGAGEGNFWLLNPSGILFGEGARLDVAGGFHASTAKTLTFSSGTGEEVFEATEGGALPGLSFAAPAAFGFLGAPTGTILLDGSCLPTCQGTGASSVEFVANRVEVGRGAGLVMKGGDIRLEGRDAVVLTGRYDPGTPGEPSDDSNAIVQVVNAGGQEGNIEIEGGDVQLEDGASLVVFNLGGTASGSIDVEALREIHVSGTDSREGETKPAFPTDPVELPNPEYGSSDLLVYNITQVQDTGSIKLSAPRVTLRDGAQVTTVNRIGSAAQGGIQVSAAGELLLAGRGGDGLGSRIQSASAAEFQGVSGEVLIDETGAVTLRDGAAIASNTYGSTPGGSVTAALTGNLRLEGGSTIQAATLGSGKGGSVVLSAAGIEIEEASSISVESQGAGDAGDIRLTFSDSLELRNGFLRATANESDGGNIFVNASGLAQTGSGAIETPLRALKAPGTPKGQLVHLIDSAISATVADGNGSGGNVAIDPVAIVLENGQITAKAVGGSGGNILLVADAVLANLPLEQLLDASSQTGVTGTVTVQSPEVNIERSLKPLATPFLDPASLVIPSCTARGTASGSFTYAPREGLPASPGDLLLVTLAEGEADADKAVPPGEGALAAGLQARARQLQAAGKWAESAVPLQAAFAKAEAAGDVSRAAAIRADLAASALALRAFEAARVQLDAAQAEAEAAQAEVLLALLAVRRADLAAVQQRGEAAGAGYRDAVARAEAAGALGLAAQAHAGAARAALEVGALAEARQHIEAARAGLGSVEDGASRRAAQLHVAVSASRLAQQAGTGEALLAAHALLSEAQAAAQAAGDARSRSFAEGELAELYARQHRVEEALVLTRRALASAEQSEAAGDGVSSDARMRWHGLAGRLFWEQGRAHQAVESYGRAVSIAEETGQDTRARYGAGPAWFQAEVVRIYRERVDALLQAAGPGVSEAQRQALLAAARETMEGLKVAELRDYFRDECVAELQASERGVESLDPTAAVIYPIVLPDRLELLVSGPKGLERHTVAVDQAALEAEVRRFRLLLEKRTTHEYLDPAEQLHAWLIAPYAETLAGQGVDTLVFVPGGALRTVPMAALYDGNEFVVQRFAVAVTPSLRLLAPKPLDPASATLLLAGVSEPVQGFPELPGVLRELAGVESLYGGRVLLDGAFATDGFEQALASGRPGVVHIASHAEFTGDPKTSFVLTHDDRLSMEKLSSLVRSVRAGDEPVELLLLSACETAAGNDRAALGLSGVAVRAGARSAIGSLWSVSDAAAAKLVVGFYRGLGEPGSSKARAMQQAQAALLETPRYRHPFYWAPFLVINNWL